MTRLKPIRSKIFIIRSNGSSYPFKKIHHPFERLVLAVNKKNSSSVRTPRAIRPKKFIIRSRKLISRSNDSSYMLKKETLTPVILTAVPTRQAFIIIRHASLNEACRHVYIKSSRFCSSFPSKGSPFERLDLSVQKRNNQLFWWLFQGKTRLQNFIK